MVGTKKWTKFHSFQRLNQSWYKLQKIRIVNEHKCKNNLIQHMEQYIQQKYALLRASHFDLELLMLLNAMTAREFKCNYHYGLVCD